MDRDGFSLLATQNVQGNARGEKTRERCATFDEFGCRLGGFLVSTRINSPNYL